MIKETKLYDTLNVKPEASQDEIKKGYRYAARPDACPDARLDARLNALLVGSMPMGPCPC